MRAASGSDKAGWPSSLDAPVLFMFWLPPLPPPPYVRKFLVFMMLASDGCCKFSQSKDLAAEIRQQRTYGHPTGTPTCGRWVRRAPRVDFFRRKMAQFSALMGLFWSILAEHFLYSCNLGRIKRLETRTLMEAVQFYRIRAMFLGRRRVRPGRPTPLQFHCAPGSGNYVQIGRGD